MSPRSASHGPRHDWRALREVSPTQGWISDPYLPSSALHGSHCLSRDFTRSAKPALEKQTSQLSPVMQQCMDSAWVWLLAGPIKCNWLSVTLWSVFQYPVTNVFVFFSTLWKPEFLHLIIKTHSSESWGQEEAACTRVFWPMRLLQWVIYTDGSSKIWKRCNSATIAVSLT